MARLYCNFAVLDPAFPLLCTHALCFLAGQAQMVAGCKTVLTIRDIAQVLRHHESGHLRLRELRSVTITQSVSAIGNNPLVIGYGGLLRRYRGAQGEAQQSYLNQQSRFKDPHNKFHSHYLGLTIRADPWLKDLDDEEERRIHRLKDVALSNKALV
jgi:hypothetical protein